MTYSDIARFWYKFVADTASEACSMTRSGKATNHIVR